MHNHQLSTLSDTDYEPAPGKTFDHALMGLIANGDRRAFELLFTRHNVRIYRFVLRLTGNRMLAEDIVTEVFLSVWQNAHQFRAESQVSTWLLSIAHRRTCSARRRRAEASIDDETASAIPDDAADPEACVEQKTRSAIMQACLIQLSPAHREIIDLVYYQEKSVKDVAQIVRIPEGTVKTRVFHARARLAELLKAQGICDARA
jgi:RNA polymerase sigma-70 factor (ECF subfamily)